MTVLDGLNDLNILVPRVLVPQVSVAVPDDLAVAAAVLEDPAVAGALAVPDDLTVAVPDDLTVAA